MRKLMLAPLLMAGCLSHIAPDRNPDHLAIRWNADWETARVASVASARPILVVFVAGDITEHC